MVTTNNQYYCTKCQKTEEKKIPIPSTRIIIPESIKCSTCDHPMMLLLS